MGKGAPLETATRRKARDGREWFVYILECADKTLYTGATDEFANASPATWPAKAPDIRAEIPSSSNTPNAAATNAAPYNANMPLNVLRARKNCAYAKESGMHDMLVKLYDLDRYSKEKTVEIPGIVIRKPIGPEKHVLTEWVGKRFFQGLGRRIRHGHGKPSHYLFYRR